MNTEPSVKLVKKEQRKGSELQAEVECAIDLNRWSDCEISESYICSYCIINSRIV
jgi:hypothetical protein